MFQSTNRELVEVEKRRLKSTADFDPLRHVENLAPISFASEYHGVRGVTLTCDDKGPRWSINGGRFPFLNVEL